MAFGAPDRTGGNEHALAEPRMLDENGLVVFGIAGS